MAYSYAKDLKQVRRTLRGMVQVGNNPIVSGVTSCKADGEFFAASDLPGLMQSRIPTCQLKVGVGEQ